MNDLKRKVKAVPDEPGIYKFLNQKGQIIYIGKAKSLKKRVSSYFSSKNLGPKTNKMVKEIKNIKVTKVFSEFEALLLEAEEIRKNKPFYNIEAKDDKSPLYIKISSDEIPLLSTVRNHPPKPKEFLKGPFTNSTTAKDILKITRRIFPYCHHKNPKRPCLFVHLGLCPYPYASKESKEKYLKSITRIKKLLQGKSKQIIHDIKKEMVASSLAQEFEKANELKKKIEQLEFLAATYHAPKEFLETPTLVDDITLKRLESLKEVLELKKTPKRIECYDISNIGGKDATGSMVVFESGRKAKDQYRRFKIKYAKKPDDYAMLREVIQRRLINDWPKPDLIVIDGGKGQLNAVLNAISELRLFFNVISIAKKLEEIYTPHKVLPISLPKNHEARLLIEQVRNEAHRFAVSYHRLIRSKRLLD